MAQHFVTTDWLAEHIEDTDVVLVDASWYLPTADRDAHDEYLASHLPDAVFFDIDKIADRSTDLPHMLPSPEEFAAWAGGMGIGSKKTIVIYDEPGLYSAPRVWWTFRVMGAPDVRILEGGGAKWRAEGRPTESGEPAASPAIFEVHFRPDLVRDFEAVKTGMLDGDTRIADARPADRFAGTAPEPRPGLKSGHIPGAVSIPATTLSSDGVLKPREELQVIFASAGLDLDAPIITSCGSGVTASTLALALDVAGAANVAVYDGSWAEWGARGDAPVEV